MGELRLRRQQFIQRRIQVLHCFRHCEGIHFLPSVLASFDGRFQVMTCNLDGERVGDDFARARLILLPGAMRQRDRDRLAIRQELDVHGIGMARRDGYNEALIEAVNVCFGPAVLRVEVIEHGKESIAFTLGPQQTSPSR